MRNVDKTSCVLFATLLVLIPTSCSRKQQNDPTSQRLARCMDDIKKIPVMAGVLRSSERDEQEKARPLEGMRIALTINGMIKSEGEPEKGIDTWCEFENSQENFDKIVSALKRNHIPPTVAFIVGKNADPKILDQWLASGNLLGNLTYSHGKIRRKAPENFINDIARNDETLAPFLSEHQQMKKYFRYPRLKISRDSEIGAMIGKHLQENGYASVSGSIELPADIFSDIYCAALARSDQTCATLIVDHFKKLALDSTLKSRAIARRRIGTDIRHILILRSNQFLCDNLDSILAWYRGLGAEFIPLDEALTDPVYSMLDEKGRSVARYIIRTVKSRQTLARGR